MNSEPRTTAEPVQNNTKFLFIALLTLTTVAACGKKDEGQVAVAPAPAVTYVMQNGSCVQTGTTTVVAMSLCPQPAAYYSNGTHCLQTGTNIIVGAAPCPTQLTWQPSYPGEIPPPGVLAQLPPGFYPGVGGRVDVNFNVGGAVRFQIGGSVGGTIGTGDLICRGWFFDPNRGWGICNGFNCRGMVMISQLGPVYCP